MYHLRGLNHGIGAFAFWQHNKGNFLYCVSIAQLTMDYLPKAVEDGVVDSSPSHKVPVVVNLPSPLRGKAMLKSLRGKAMLRVQ